MQFIKDTLKYYIEKSYNQNITEFDNTRLELLENSMESMKKVIDDMNNVSELSIKSLVQENQTLKEKISKLSENNMINSDLSTLISDINQMKKDIEKTRKILLIISEQHFFSDIYNNSNNLSDCTEVKENIPENMNSAEVLTYEEEIKKYMYKILDNLSESNVNKNVLSLIREVLDTINFQDINDIPIIRIENSGDLGIHFEKSNILCVINETNNKYKMTVHNSDDSKTTIIIGNSVNEIKVFLYDYFYNIIY